MLSSDKNVETIVQLAEVVKHYLGLQGEYLKLEIIDKLVRLLAAIAMTFLFMILIICMGFYFSLAFAYWLAQYIGNAPRSSLSGASTCSPSSFFITSASRGLSAPSSTSLSTSS